MLHCRFFEDYKKNEGKVVKVEEIVGAAKAKETILAAMVSVHHLAIHHHPGPTVHCLHCWLGCKTLAQ